MSHPNVEALHRVVLVFSNKPGENRLFIEVPKGMYALVLSAQPAYRGQY